MCLPGWVFIWALVMPLSSGRWRWKGSVLALRAWPESDTVRIRKESLGGRLASRTLRTPLRRWMNAAATCLQGLLLDASTSVRTGLWEAGTPGTPFHSFSPLACTKSFPLYYFISSRESWIRWVFLFADKGVYEDVNLSAPGLECHRIFFLPWI